MTLRKTLLAKRRALATEQCAAAAQAVMQLLVQQPLFTASQHIACYFACDNEIDCMPIIKKIWQAQKKCYLPVLSLQQEKFLDFASYLPTDSLRLNQYKIPEPENTEKISPHQLELVLFPLIGFDHQGHRLGTGGGYYDRTFAFLREQTLQKPRLIGLAYEFQRVASVPVGLWDVLLNGVLTEKGLYSFN